MRTQIEFIASYSDPTLRENAGLRVRLKQFIIEISSQHFLQVLQKYRSFYLELLSRQKRRGSHKQAMDCLLTWLRSSKYLFECLGKNQ